jgi:hypothetical protein
MTANLYQEWLQCWDQKLGQQIPPRKILLLQDNFSGHIVPTGLKNIKVENFKPNLTAHVQPMDQGSYFFLIFFNFYFVNVGSRYYSVLQGPLPHQVY